MKILCFFLLLCFINAALFAQEKFEIHARPSSAMRTGQNNSTPLSTGNSDTGNNIDVIYHRANWTVDPNSSAAISGVVTTHFKVLVPNVTTISFDLIKSSFENTVEVKYHGISCVTFFPSSGNVNVLNITLPSIISTANTLDSVTITYSGTPIEDGLGGGFVRPNYIDQFGQPQNYITTLSESYEDRNWWPCKADMQDKIDSMDINVTVPWNNADTFWVASNGVLIDSAIAGGWRTFSYKTRYPMASYLVCLSAARYNRYYSKVEIGETNTPVYWYLLAGKESSYYNNALTAMQKMNAVAQAFSNKLGDYPFKNEKHGYYDGLVGASGMEHQTFSGIAPGALTSLVTLDHELMHQWFGDNVTFATWNDLWLAEGFARYGEILAAEFVPSLGYSPYLRRNGRKNSALSLSTTSLWIPDANIASSSTIWNSSYGSSVYERGCMIVSMLRTICGDEKFFNALTNYQTVLKGKAANADSLKRFFNDELGTDISEFFRDYVGGSGSGTTAVGGKGNPVNTIKWNSPGANKLLLGVQSQTQTAGSNVSYFNGPVAVRAKGGTPFRDTTIIFFDWGNGALSKAGKGLDAAANGNVLSYDLSFTPDSMFYDDSARTLSTGTMLPDTSFKGYTWYGTVNSDWFTAANWSLCCGVPPANADVTIATLNFPPILPASVSVHDLTINDSKFISIAANTLTINGAVKGNGGIDGSSSSNLVITGKAGLLHFVQGISDEVALRSLSVQQGATAIVGNDIYIGQLTINPTAQVTVAAGVKILTD
ncbi:MAG: M1 family aminopeptidase [Bacteroidota bacterium]